MNRRGFIALLGGTAATLAAPVPEILLPTKIFILPPRGRWHASARFIEAYDISRDRFVCLADIKVGLEQFSVNWIGKDEVAQAISRLEDHVLQKTGRMLRIKPGALIHNISSRELTSMANYTVT